MNNASVQLFFSLLEKSGLFDDSAKYVIRRSVADAVLPAVDFDYLMDAMKLEQNFYSLIDKRADQLVHDLHNKYGTSEK